MWVNGEHVFSLHKSRRIEYQGWVNVGDVNVFRTIRNLLMHVTITHVFIYNGEHVSIVNIGFIIFTSFPLSVSKYTAFDYIQSWTVFNSTDV